MINARYAILTWKPPQLSGGLVLTYKLNAYDQSGNGENVNSAHFPASTLEATISGLKPWTSYTFTVTAYTLTGNIESGAVMNKTAAAGKFDRGLKLCVFHRCYLNLSGM